MHPSPIRSLEALQGMVARSIPRRRFTVLDAVYLTGAIAIRCWSGLPGAGLVADP